MVSVTFQSSGHVGNSMQFFFALSLSRIVSVRDVIPADIFGTVHTYQISCLKLYYFPNAINYFILIMTQSL